MSKLSSILLWTLVAVTGAGAFAGLALSRGETVSAAWLLTAAVCSYLVAYRFYSKFIATRVFALDARRPTPAERLSDGRDFVPTNRWIVFGHHFAAIAGPGGAKPNPGDIRAPGAGLGRPHASGGTVVERAALMAEGADLEATVAWILAHGGEPEISGTPAPRGGLHGPRSTTAGTGAGSR